MHLIKRVILFILLNGSFCLFSQKQTDKRILEQFHEGMATDTVRIHDENGALQSLYYPYKKTYRYRGNKYRYCLFETYDEKGTCLRHMDDQIGFEKKFNANGDFIYYMIYNRKKSKLNYYIEFYPGSTKKTVITKGNRYDYDEKERLRRHWVRKGIRFDKKIGEKVATFYFEEYDVTGAISRSGRFYTQLAEQDDWMKITPEFPTALDFVPMQDFKEIVYPQLNARDVYRWDYSENKTIITRYEQQGESWIKNQRRTFPQFSKHSLSK